MRSAVLLAALLLSACASLKHQDAEVREGDLRLTGKLSVQVDADDGNPEGHKTGGSGAFELIGGPAAGQLELSTPLGSLVARASWNRNEAILKTPDAERVYFDLDALTREMLGEPIPVAALFDWMRGRAWPDAPSTSLENGFEQLGWRIDLSRFADGVLIATRKAAPTVTLRTRIEKQT